MQLITEIIRNTLVENGERYAGNPNLAASCFPRSKTFAVGSAFGSSVISASTLIGRFLRMHGGAQRVPGGSSAKAQSSRGHGQSVAAPILFGPP